MNGVTAPVNNVSSAIAKAKVSRSQPNALVIGYRNSPKV